MGVRCFLKTNVPQSGSYYWVRKIRTKLWVVVYKEIESLPAMTFHIRLPTWERLSRDTRCVPRNNESIPQLCKRDKLQMAMFNVIDKTRRGMVSLK